jgi:hypothetical protein
VQLEQLAVALRPRGGWEALDLGFQMARKWWRPIWSAWFAIYLPSAALALYLFEKPFHAVLLLWWLKPLFDRVVLHVASRAVFGEPQGVRSTLRAAGDWLRPALIPALTFYRFDFARSFALPVWQLEKQKGAAGRSRRKALGSRMRGYAVWLWVVCVHLETVSMFAIFGLMGLLEPGMGEVAPEESDTEPFGFMEAMTSWTMTDAIYYAAAVSLIEPFYVCGGFALYLNRRAVLEGWDIELALRRVQERLTQAMRAVAMLIVSVSIFGAALLYSGPTNAQTSAGQEIEKVLATPEFSQHREIKTWRYLGGSKEEKKQPSPFWLNLSLLFGDVTQRVAWVVAGVLVVLALIYLWRFVPRRGDRAVEYTPPDVLFGLEVAPQSLPGDIPGTAAALAREGRIREALSLLYRGALSSLVHQHLVALSEGDTEDDCVRAARSRLPASAYDYFGNLVRSWQSTAYADRPPAAETVLRYCEEWQARFSGPQEALA